MLYPLKFKPVYKDYIWGGRGLEKLNKQLPEGIVAESWEVSSHPDGESIISNGELEGKTINQIIKKFGKRIVGYSVIEKKFEKFPLLIKLIDANDKLSVQVHPNDEFAKENENGEYGKNEMWYIISAKPGAKIVYGVAEGVTKESFETAVKEDNIETCLNYMEVSAGDAVNIPSGLVHAIGEGILIAEIQQNSNTTYRVFDYNRTDKNGNKRPLHVEKALSVIDFNNCGIKGKLKGFNVKLEGESSKVYLVANEYFSVEKYNVKGRIKEEANGSHFITYTCIDGDGIIYYDGGVEKLAKGESILIPALMGKFYIEGNLELIKSYVPDMENDIINPLVNAGYSRQDVVF